MEGCRAQRKGDELVLENDRIRRVYAWNEGHLIGRQIVDRAGGKVWDLAGNEPDWAFPGPDVEPAGGTLSVVERPKTAYQPAHLRAEVTTRLGGIGLRRRFRIYPGCPAIACDFYLRGVPGETWARCGAVVMERLCIPDRHLWLECVQFFDITDRRNTLVASRAALPYRQVGHLSGNLLWVSDVMSDAGLFVLKEAPCSDVQLAWPGYDFAHRLGAIDVAGIGVEPDDLDEDAWTRCYGVVCGVASGGEWERLSALRSYQRRVRIHRGRRDHMIMLNTWGDRGQDTRIGEGFALAELERAAALGITHLQLDDGWQAGRSSNSAFAGGSLERIWERGDYWTPHPERFPNGLGPVVRKSRELGIELCLWFNPSKDDSYAHWRQDAEVLIGLYRAWGIRTFKIDGVVIPDKRADRNLRAMLERVMAATQGEAVFNLDVTAGRRWGYHYGNAYGNIFVENRYTDWGNYYPHWTLRTLWMLARYVPAQNLQIEFLNKWRNPDRYPAEDPLAPQHVPFAYCFAITMMAQPLAWFEATGLPQEALSLGATIRAYRAHQERMHAGTILPIGEEPSGVSWTGLQSIGRDGGYVVVYREYTERARARLRLWRLAGKRIHCRQVVGQGADFTGQVDADGGLEFALPERFTFALYEYRVLA